MEHTMYQNQMPKEAKLIIQALEEVGYEAYIVGGCVRDLLMGRVPHDWDITTSAKPEEVKAVFPRTYDTGIEHGTVTVILSKEHFEVTTYRIEDDYRDHRRPNQVNFVTDLTKDLSRRDFTMNAIAYHPEKGFVDPYDGVRAIQNKQIICVRNPEERFTEDGLRILRALRFSAQLGFLIEESTLEGIRKCKELLTHISKERIRDELVKICISDRPDYIKHLYELALLPYIIPELGQTFKTPQNHPHHRLNVGEHTLEAMQNSPKDLITRMALLLHDIGKPATRSTDEKGTDHFYGHVEVSVQMTYKILKDLRFDNKSIKEIGLLVSYHDYHLEKTVDKIEIKKVLRYVEPELFDKLLWVQLADARAQALDKLPPKERELERIKNLKEEIVANKECYQLKDLAITGQDLLSAKLAKGKQIGEALEVALSFVLEEPSQNKKEILLEKIESYIGK